MRGETASFWEYFMDFWLSSFRRPFYLRPDFYMNTRVSAFQGSTAIILLMSMDFGLKQLGLLKFDLSFIDGNILLARALAFKCLLKSR